MGVSCTSGIISMATALGSTQPSLAASGAAGSPTSTPSSTYGIAERPGHAAAAPAEVRVPEVVGEVPCRPGGGQGVPVAVAADGEEHGDVVCGLAVLDVGADGGCVVAGEFGRVCAVAEDAEEGDDHCVVGAGVAGLAERALVPVAASEDGQVLRLAGGGWAGDDAPFFITRHACSCDTSCVRRDMVELAWQQ
uniref:Uncharacterized protein n=1 Tax=Setaria italica TaxID=4555 RepID=K3ZMV2_SETIT